MNVGELKALLGDDDSVEVLVMDNFWAEPVALKVLTLPDGRKVIDPEEELYE